MADFRGPDGDGGPQTHVVGETGLAVRLDGDGLAGTARVVPELHVPGTDVLRTSVLATWVDVVTGLLSMPAIPDRVPVTLDLSVDVLEPVRGCPQVDVTCRLVKAGRSVAVLAVEFTADGGPVVAVGSATFVASPDARFTLPPLAETVSSMRGLAAPLRVPLAERADCSRQAPSSAVLLRREDGLNATGTVNGALLALVVEEAVLAGSPAGATLTSLVVRYLRPVRLGPAVATADVHATAQGGFARVQVYDRGADDRLAIDAIARTT